MDNFKQRNVGTKKCNATNGKTQNIEIDILLRQ